jgi:hypothetical protein
MKTDVETDVETDFLTSPWKLYCRELLLIVLLKCWP